MLKELINLVSNSTLQLPAVEVCLALSVLSLSMVFRLTRFGLIFAYLLSYRWGWSLFVGKSEEYMLGYLVFGMITGILTVIGMIQSDHMDD
jgi:hypothetical protein